LEDFIVVCDAAFYLSLEWGTKSAAKYVKYLGAISDMVTQAELLLNSEKEKLFL
jgi:hypothetical protein